MESREDALILDCIRGNSRCALADIHRKTKIPVSTIFVRLRRIEASVVEKYVSFADFSYFGFGVRMAFAISANKKDRKMLKIFLSKFPNINNIYQTGNGFDFFVEAVFRNLAEVDSFSDKLGSFRLKKMFVYHLIEDLKREGLTISSQEMP